MWPLPRPVISNRKSADQLRGLSIGIAQIFRRWLGDNFTPRILCSQDVGLPHDVKLLPGGCHVAVLESDCTLAFHSIRDGKSTPVRIKHRLQGIADGPAPGGHNELVVAATSQHEGFLVHSHSSDARYELHLRACTDNNRLLGRRLLSIITTAYNYVSAGQAG